MQENKLSSAELLGLSSDAVSELVPKEVVVFIGGKESAADIKVKRLSYDETVNLTREEDIKHMLMADLIKKRVVATVYNAETNKPLFKTQDDVGKCAPQIIDALHAASDVVNDFSGKQQAEHLRERTKSSGVSLSAAESAEGPSQKPSET